MENLIELQLGFCQVILVKQEHIEGLENAQRSD
jgi:hypothetical protein